jgi:hypothetical protein
LAYAATSLATTLAAGCTGGVVPQTADAGPVRGGIQTRTALAPTLTGRLLSLGTASSAPYYKVIYESRSLVPLSSIEGEFYLKILFV